MTDGVVSGGSFEQIGTTKTDLAEYAKSITINGQTYSATANEVDLGTGFANKVATGQAITLANQDSVYANIATDGTLTVGVADASTTGKGLVQLASDVASNSATGVTTASAVKAYADTKVGSVQYCNAYCLKSETMKVSNGVLSIDHQWVSGSAHDNVYEVINNVASNGNPEDAIGVIETNMIKDGTNMFSQKDGLRTFDSNLDNLENGYFMMY